MVSRAALRAGKMLASADKARTNPSQIAYPEYVNTTSIGVWNTARLTMVESKYVNGMERITANPKEIMPINTPSAMTVRMTARSSAPMARFHYPCAR